MSKSAVFWLLLIGICLEVAFVCAFLPETLLHGVLKSDVNGLHSVLSEDRMKNAVKWAVRAEQWAFEDSGFKGVVYQHYVPKEIDAVNAKEIVPGWVLFAWCRQRFDLLLDYSVVFFFRMNILLQLSAMLAPIFVATAVDSISRRSISIAEFKVPSAVIYHRAKAGLTVSLFGTIALCVLPVRLGPTVYFAWLALFGISMWAVLRHVQEI